MDNEDTLLVALLIGATVTVLLFMSGAEGRFFSLFVTLIILVAFVLQMFRLSKQIDQIIGSTERRKDEEADGGYDRRAA